MYILYIYIYICMYNESYVSFNASETSLAKVTLFFLPRAAHPYSYRSLQPRAPLRSSIFGRLLYSFCIDLCNSLKRS